MYSIEAARAVGSARGLLLAAHPAPAFAVTAVAVALAAGSGRGAAGSLLAGAAVLAGQLSIGWCNDRVDLRRDVAAGRGDKPLVTGAARPGAVALAAGGALALCVPLSLANGLSAGSAHLVGVAAAWAYNLGVKRTVLSWLPYALAFGLLPAFVTLALPGHPWPAGWATAAGALLGTGAHAANVLPDIEDDLRAGVRGLPQRLGRGWARVLAAGPLLAASVVLVLGPPGRVGVGGWATLAGAAALALLTGSAATRGRTPFLAALGLAALDVALLVLRGVTLS
ncbi:4-hydroxybenzoate polyprenyltransferase [Kitasatospora sp. MAP12-15]|uniref:UbiA family prenyltransferase n=1 Tax=unclassified Kitasatospora TaxID=2633591 RepID=UPI002473FA93|nr:UbiA family prenyltransferase [Kitasatospora sp. MAP12-44]MDH6109445.1 4-hydroxybenzoate polyprenyltransferase [Kitasatospora sp. MAP12-44]